MTLTNECSVTQFIDDHDPIRLLTDTTSIKFLPEDDVYREHKDTSDEIVTCLSDLKVCTIDCIIMCMSMMVLIGEKEMKNSKLNIV